MGNQIKFNPLSRLSNRHKNTLFNDIQTIQVNNRKITYNIAQIEFKYEPSNPSRSKSLIGGKVTKFTGNQKYHQAKFTRGS